MKFGFVLRGGSVSEQLDHAVVAEAAGIDVIDALWRGEIKHRGARYELDIAPGHVLDLIPVQQPRVPIWVVGAWPRPKSMRRVLKCDGILPVVSMPGRDSPLSPEDVRELAAWLADRGASSTSPTQPSPDSRPRRTYSELP